MPIGWDEARPGADPAELAALEQSLGRELPAEYRSFLLEHDGGEPESNEFDDMVAVDEFLAVAEIVEARADYGDRVPDGWVPVADAAGGNLVLVALDDGRVAFWDHELEDEGPVSVIAPGFAAFWEALRPFDQASVKLEPGQVISVWVDPDLPD